MTYTNYPADLFSKIVPVCTGRYGFCIFSPCSRVRFEKNRKNYYFNTSDVLINTILFLSSCTQYYRWGVFIKQTDAKHRKHKREDTKCHRSQCLSVFVFGYCHVVVGFVFRLVLSSTFPHTIYIYIYMAANDFVYSV